MPDIIDLLNLMKSNPQAVKSMDAKKLAEYNLTSAELEKIKTLDPALVKRVVAAIDAKLRVGPVAGTNACPGTNACFGGKLSVQELRKIQQVGR